MSIRKAIALLGGETAQRGGPTPVVDFNGNSALASAVAQQVSSLGGNGSFKIKQTLTANTNEIDFSRSNPPPLVRPMNSGPSAEDFEALVETVETLTRKVQTSQRVHRTKYEAANDLLGTPQGPMEIDGGPGFVFLDASGRYIAYRVTPFGLEYAREVKRK